MMKHQQTAHSLLPSRLRGVADVASRQRLGVGKARRQHPSPFNHTNAPDWMQQEAALVRRTLRLRQLLRITWISCTALVIIGTAAGLALQISRWI